MLLLAAFHTTTAFMATTGNRFRSRAAAGAARAELPGGSVRGRGAETRIAAASGFFENLFGGLKVGLYRGAFGLRYLSPRCLG